MARVDGGWTMDQLDRIAGADVNRPLPDAGEDS